MSDSMNIQTKKRHIVASIWIWLMIILYGSSFFRHIGEDAPWAALFSMMRGFLYIMLLFWNKWAFWGIILFPLINFLIKFVKIPIEDTAIFQGSAFSYILVQVFFALILFGVLKIKSKNGKDTWEQLKPIFKSNKLLN